MSIGEGIDPVPLAVRVERQRKVQLEDTISTISDEVRHLAELSNLKKREAEDMYAQWVDLQQQSADVILRIIHETAGTPYGCHVLRAVINVLRRDEKRLITDLDRLANVHSEEDSNFHQKRQQLEDAKQKSENVILDSQDLVSRAAAKSCDHRLRVSELKGELQRSKECFKDNIILHAQNLFCK
eukprot:TRINITY_DN33936_c0_g1_i1.p1 TRINITY_DN33936_c0_g1~~TRINITY_DN33936_c0_g1_i1.p1  ORF type:complete len:201 (+),score=43.68 TRINITY_DN33936_c0_g1_i1:53-604(+)